MESDIARRLELPRQQVGYHMRELQGAGRPGGTGGRAAQGKLPGTCGARRRDRFSLGHLVSLAARAIRDLAVLCSHAGKAGKRDSTMALEVEVHFASA